MPPRILLVEDDEDQRSGLAELLRREGFEVTEADDAETALGMLERDRFDLLVSDYQLAGATGTWLARVAKQSLRQVAPGVLIITGHDTVADPQGLTILRKPLDPSRFLGEIRQALAFQPGEGASVITPNQRVALLLYVTNSLPSHRTKKAVQTVMTEYDPTQIAFTVVDLRAETAFQAEQHRVVAAPTLVKTFPPPRVWITGEFVDHNLVRRLLEEAGVERRR